MTPLTTADPPRLMLDTHIVADLMRNPQGLSNQTLARRLASCPQLRVCLSTVVDCEVQFGLYRKRSKPLTQAYAVPKTIDKCPIAKTGHPARRSPNSFGNDSRHGIAPWNSRLDTIPDLRAGEVAGRFYAPHTGNALHAPL